MYVCVTHIGYRVFYRLAALSLIWLALEPVQLLGYIVWDTRTQPQLTLPHGAPKHVTGVVAMSKARFLTPVFQSNQDLVLKAGHEFMLRL